MHIFSIIIGNKSHKAFFLALIYMFVLEYGTEGLRKPKLTSAILFCNKY